MQWKSMTFYDLLHQWSDIRFVYIKNDIMLINAIINLKLKG